MSISTAKTPMVPVPDAPVVTTRGALKAPIVLGVVTVLISLLVAFKARSGDTTFRLATESDFFELPEVTVPSTASLASIVVLLAICTAASATLFGSIGSTARGIPVLTLQKAQARVQVSPRIITVACFLLQHSPIFGHAASSHTVVRLFERISARVAAKPAEVGALTRIQSGLRWRSGRATGVGSFIARR